MSEITEITRLREHNAELLAELKAAKGKIKQFESDLATVTAERDTAAQRLYAETTGRRINALMDYLAPPKFGKFLLTELQEQGRIKIDGDSITLIEPNGKVSDINPDDHQSVYRWLESETAYHHLIRGIGASGSGAMPSVPYRANTETNSQAAADKPQQSPVKFGLK